MFTPLKRKSCATPSPVISFLLSAAGERENREAPTSKLLDCVIEMARTLSLRIIAEGVETEAQRDYLNRQNIHLLQGYYFWKPMPYVALVMLLLSKPKARIVEE